MMFSRTPNANGLVWNDSESESVQHGSEEKWLHVVYLHSVHAVLRGMRTRRTDLNSFSLQLKCYMLSKIGSNTTRIVL